MSEAEDHDGPFCEGCGDPLTDDDSGLYCDSCLGAAEEEADDTIAAFDIRVTEIPEGRNIDKLYEEAETRTGQPIRYGDDVALLNWLRHIYTNYHDLLESLDYVTARRLKAEVNKRLIEKLEAAGIEGFSGQDLDD
jgi:hypothetical protein